MKYKKQEDRWTEEERKLELRKVTDITSEKIWKNAKIGWDE